jgi:transcriptional regulator GlxA family with amidase domain
LAGWLKVFGAGPATDVGEGPILRIGLIVPPGFAVLSFAPLSVFEAANMVLANPFYEVHAVSMSGGRIPNSFGMEMETVRVTDGTFDTLLIGSPLDVRPQSPELLSFLQSAPSTTRRIASICIGAFILGEAGLLDGRRATTHWFYANELQRRYPRVTVEMDRIFIADGQIWTSAGMTAGIDLALGLVERDIGREKTRELARMLVMRPADSHSTPRCWTWMPHLIACRRPFNSRRAIWPCR